MVDLSAIHFYLYPYWIADFKGYFWYDKNICIMIARKNMESWLFLLAILGIAFVGCNNSLLIATFIVLGIKLLPPLSSKLFPLIQSKGINWGVTLISIAILIPIATGKIRFIDLFHAMKTPAGWIAVGCGIAVAILSRHGVNLLTDTPQVTVALVLGTIIGVVFLKGVAAGPIIAAGITYYIVTFLHLSFT